MKKKTLGLILLGLLGMTSVFAQTKSTTQKVQLSPLFPPALKVHQSYIDRWTSPRISIKTPGLEHSLSLNWSGYASMTSLAEPMINSVTRVSGQWTVPEVHKSSSAKTYSSIWVGFDGYSNDVVEQIGTSQYWYDGKQHNFAWIELYPSWPYEIVSFPVRVGDKIFASVVNKNNENYFMFTLKNKTKNKKFSIETYQPYALNQSAEWIVEAPSSNSGVLPLAKFSKITLKKCFATINGVKGSIDAHGREYDAIEMVAGTLVPKSVPSKLTCDGSKFTLTWHHE